MEESKKQFKAALLLALVVSAVTLLAVFVGFQLAGGNSAPAADPVPAAEETAAGAVPADVSQGGIQIPGFEVMTLRAGTFSQACDLLYNPAANDCTMVFSLFLPDGTPFYQSGPVSPGQRLEALELSAKLTADSYPEAVLRYDCFDSSTFEPLNGAEIKFTLEVIE